MPTIVGKPGFEMTQGERIAALVAMVGGPTKAAAIIGRTRTHIDNMRKPGAPLRLEDLLPLAIEAKVSLDWVATGHQVRDDLRGTGMAEQLNGFGEPERYVRLPPLRPIVDDPVVGQRVERWEPSPIGVSAEWLGTLGLPASSAAYFLAGDAGMDPLVPRGAIALVDTRRPVKPRGGIYAVEIDGDLAARRLISLPNGSSELAADAWPNWRYSLPADGGPKVYRIVWAGHAF